MNTYSIDMVRFRVKIFSQNFYMWEKVMGLSNDPGVKYFTSFNFKEYRHLWRVSENGIFNNTEYSFALMFQHNAEKLGGKYSLVLEYNPNKVLKAGRILDSLLKTFYDNNGVELQQVDVAIDIPDNINNFVVDKQGLYSYKLIDNGGDDKTHYIGKGNGRVKIYNKKRQAGLRDELTRYEITIKVKLKLKDIEQFDFQGSLPTVHRVNIGEDMDATLSALVYAVLQGWDISRLTRSYKKKVRDVINHQEHEFIVDRDCVNNAVKQWVARYLEEVAIWEDRDSIKYVERKNHAREGVSDLRNKLELLI